MKIYDCIILGTGYGGLGMGAQLVRDEQKDFLTEQGIHAIY